eukprot:8601722-Lingulodinium_polyedra.AAC.1
MPSAAEGASGDASSAQAGGTASAGLVKYEPEGGEVPMDVSEDPLAATIQQLPEFEVNESDATVVIYPIPEGVDLEKLHAIVGRF